VMALARDGALLDVRGVSLAGGPADVRVRRYYALGDSSAVPRELFAELAAMPGEMLRAAARASAAAPVAIAEVVEASREVDARVVEAFLVERGQRFDVDAKRLVAMSRAGVPESVIDLVIALSYPGRFHINGPAREAELRPDERVVSAAPAPGTAYPDRYGYGRRANLCYDPLYAAPYYPSYASSACLGYTPYGWGRGAWGYGYSYYGAGGGIVVVREPTTGAGRSAGGKMVKGRGYVGGSSTDGRTAEPRSGDSSTGRTTTSSQPSSSSGSTGSSSGSTSSGSKGTSSGGGRTAKPRNP
jgi:hypothetical protein